MGMEYVHRFPLGVIAVFLERRADVLRRWLAQERPHVADTPVVAFLLGAGQRLPVVGLKGVDRAQDAAILDSVGRKLRFEIADVLD